MTKTTLGRTDVPISQLCLGTLGFGWTTNRETSLDILDQFVESGGNFIQATSVYPALPDEVTWTNLSELYVGEWLEGNSGNRNRVFISSRVSINPHSGEGPADQIIAACESSLRKLRTDYLDLFVCQWNSSLAEAEPVLRALTSLVRLGKIRYFGFGGFPLWRVMETLAESFRGSYARLESFQTEYSLMERSSVEKDVAEFCRERRVSLLASSPLAGGYLGARYDALPDPSTERARRLVRRYNSVRGAKVHQELESIAHAAGESVATVALAWVLQNPVVSSAIIGVRTKHHLREAIRATQMDLSISHLHQLDVASSSPAAGAPKRKGPRQPLHSGSKSRGSRSWPLHPAPQLASLA